MANLVVCANIPNHFCNIFFIYSKKGKVEPSEPLLLFFYLHCSKQKKISKKPNHVDWSFEPDLLLKNFTKQCYSV